MAGEYNGWSSYITWRIWNDILSKIEFKDPVNEDQLMEIVKYTVISDLEIKNGSHLATEYAGIFIVLANYKEMADRINRDLK